MLKKISDLVTWFVFSPRCLLCKLEIYEDNSLCASCWSKLSFIVNAFCNKCGKMFKSQALVTTCACKGNRHYYTKARAALVYDNYSAKLIYNLKYNDNLQARNTLARWMLRAGEQLITESDIVTAVPLYKDKLKHRKYNQSLILAKGIAQYTSLKLIPNLLIKVKDTSSQSGLSRKLRKANVANAFRVNYKKYNIRGKNILLIDDVITTGATVSECARILRSYGARRVFVLTLVHTPDH